MPDRHDLRRRLPDLATAVGAWVASGMVPALVITVQSLVARDADATVAFALRVAEPLSLLGAAGVVALVRATGRRAGLVRGALAAAVVAVGAAWTGDADAWTAAAAMLLPAVGAIAARRGRTDARELPPAAHAELRPSAAAPIAVPVRADAPDAERR